LEGVGGKEESKDSFFEFCPEIDVHNTESAQNLEKAREL
jgi:hypothetical protein